MTFINTRRTTAAIVAAICMAIPVTAHADSDAAQLPGARTEAPAILWDSPNRLPPRSASKRERLLAAASRLFYVEGINSEGIERIIKEGRVTLATF
jgi:hypothetical protein